MPVRLPAAGANRGGPPPCCAERLSAALVVYRRSISRSGPDDRKDNNNGIGADCACTRKSGCVRGYSCGPRPHRLASASPPFGSHTEPDPDAETR